MIALSIWGRLEAVASAFELPQKPHPFSAAGLEHQQVFAVDEVVSDSAVTTLEHHVTDLSLSEVAEHPFWRPAIIITMLLTARTSEQYYERVLAWSAYTSLLLPSIGAMDVAATVVYPLLVK